jgi:hypothetical protein
LGWSFQLGLEMQRAARAGGCAALSMAIGFYRICCGYQLLSSWPDLFQGQARPGRERLGDESEAARQQLTLYEPDISLPKTEVGLMISRWSPKWSRETV